MRRRIGASHIAIGGDTCGDMASVREHYDGHLNPVYGWMIGPFDVAKEQKARTPADHLELRGYFGRLEEQYTADATAHVAMTGIYIGTRIARAATHCEQMASQARELARGAKEAAAEQGRLAAAAR